jgi:UvrD/REP helicase N-terminal domain
MTALDQSQKKFCEAPTENVRLLAPAGCGKTLSLLYRCRHLIENGKAQRTRFLIVTSPLQRNRNFRDGSMKKAISRRSATSWK